MARRRRTKGHHSQRGVATLIVVMVLFFIVSLLAAYTNRNMIFEQRTAANQYRSTQALEAADAGIQWALAMLNGGRVDDACLPSADPANNTFRDRYLSAAGADQSAVNSDTSITIRNRSDGTPLMPACVFDAASNSWSCHCPSDDATTLPTVTGTAAQPMFRVRFEYITGSGSPPAVIRPDVVRIVSAGCTRPDASCLAPAPIAPAGDAMAVVSVLTTLRSGLATPPGAAVTTRGNLDAGSGPFQVVNADPASNGITLDAGGSIAGSPTLISLPGAPADSSALTADSALVALADADRMFGNVFGMAATIYQQQPAAVVVDCSAVCDAAALNAQIVPGHVLWLNGDLRVDGNIGSPSNPVMVVVNGNASLVSGSFVGVLYARTAGWSLGVGTTQVRGALVAETDLSTSGTQQVIYDPAVLALVHQRLGSFIEVPGSWEDF